MLQETKWTKHAKWPLGEYRVGAYEVEQAVQQEHHRRRPNNEDADWEIEKELPEGRGTLIVYYDWPQRLEGDGWEFEDETSAVVVTFVVE
jgi:hypothetical protein